MRTPLDTHERVRFEDTSEVLCAGCGEPLDRHQPDERRPERLIGTCPACGGWFAIMADSQTVIELPG